MGQTHTVLREPRRAIELHEQQLAIARESGDRQGEVDALDNMGNAYAQLGEPRRAIELYDQQREIARELGDRSGEAISSWNLGLCYEDLGELERAIAVMQVYVDFLHHIGHADAESHAEYVDALRARLKDRSAPALLKPPSAALALPSPRSSPPSAAAGRPALAHLAGRRK